MTTATVATDNLLTVADAAKRLGTWETSGERFPRMLISQRRIRFVRVGRLVRIPESAIAEYIEARQWNRWFAGARGRWRDGYQERQAPLRVHPKATLAAASGELHRPGRSSPDRAQHVPDQARGQRLARHSGVGDGSRCMGRPQSRRGAVQPLCRQVDR